MDDEKNKDQGLGKTVFEDLKREDVKGTIRRDFQDIQEFFLDQDHRENLAGMGKFKRLFFSTIWLFKSLFLKLTPVRRLLMILSLVLIYLGFNSDSKFHALDMLGSLTLLFILMLELKDKLLAKDELKEGRAVQLALLPATSPDIRGWDIWLHSQPANDVGGDLIDILQLDNDRFGISLGDVSGKGLGAALFMSKLQSTLRALATDASSLSQLGNKLNLIFHRDSISRSFATLFYLEIMSGNSQFQWLNAGHMPPIIVRQNQLIPLPKGDPALGLQADVTFHEQKNELRSGDYLIIYSDGLTEAMNDSGDFFGNERPNEILKNISGSSSRSVGHRIKAAVDRFRGDAPHYDDLSLIILKRL